MGRVRASATVAVLGSSAITRELGKKGTSSDITLYNLARDGRVLTSVEATQFPEKFPPLLYALAVADKALLIVSSLSRAFAETVATLELFDVPVDVYAESGVAESEIRRAFRGTRFEETRVAALDVPRLRDELMAWSPPRIAEPPVHVRIDHFFPVKGVGPVALGFVRRGVLRVHDKLRLFPTDRLAEVRSIQVQDIDVTDAGPGTRVGVALKGIDIDELARGQVLAPTDSLAVVDTFRTGRPRVSRFYRGTVTPGAQLHLLWGLQLVPARIDEAGAERWVVTSDRALAGASGDPIWLVDLSVGAGSRLVGTAVPQELELP
jgi:selenocysteine-specific translation elongation factor